MRAPRRRAAVRSMAISSAIMKHAPPAPPELGEPRRPGLRAVPARGRSPGGRRDPARRRLGEGEPLRLRAASAATTGWPRSPSTRAGTGARGRLRAGRDRATCSRWRPAARARAGGRAARVEHGRLPGDPRGRAPTRRSARSWRSARRPRTCCCAGCAPASSERLRGATARRTSRGSERSTSTTPPARLGPETALLLLHARGDEQVPYTVSEELYEAAREPKRLLVFPGGHHRSLQHDLEVQDLSRRASSSRPLARPSENHSRLGCCGALARSTSSRSPFLRDALVELVLLADRGRDPRRLDRAAAARLLLARGRLGHLPRAGRRRCLGVSPTLAGVAVALGYAGGVERAGRAGREPSEAHGAAARRRAGGRSRARQRRVRVGRRRRPAAVRDAARPGRHRPRALGGGRRAGRDRRRSPLGRAWAAVAFDPDAAAATRAARRPRRLPAARRSWPWRPWRRSPPSASCSSTAIYVLPAAAARLLAGSVPDADRLGARARARRGRCSASISRYWLDVPPGPPVALLGAGDLPRRCPAGERRR